MFWFNKINIHHCKNDQNIFLLCYLLIDIHELKIITFCWNIWHPIRQTEYDFFEILMQEFDSLIDYNFQEGPKTKAPQHEYDSKWIWNQYLSYRSYHQKQYFGILGNKFKYEANFQKSFLPVETYFVNTLFMATPIIR